ncbi:Fic family protein [Candidatus Woesearchaeota archaeon]|nr:Fic family protein [Candidatus Woesearchaeota archaeon]
MINKKDIVRVNQEIGETGRFHNESSMEYALSMIKHKKSWLYELAYIARSLLTDHAFIDGNKRTALAIILTYFEGKEEYDKEMIAKIILQISKKQEKDVNKIMRMIKSAILY